MRRKWGVPKMPYNEKISIIMPAYNAEKTIERAIESVQRQTYTNWQLVIVMMVQKMRLRQLLSRSAKRTIELRATL